MQITETTIVPIAVAIVAGFISLIGLIISKEQKTSEFRQDWINTLRHDISEFVATVSSYTSYMLLYKNNHPAYNTFLSENTELINNLTQSYERIRLKVNPNDDKNLLNYLDQVYNLAASNEYPSSIEEVTKKTDDLIKESQLLLKKEWTRVKKGEKKFQYTQYFIIFIVVIGIIGGVSLYFKNEKSIPVSKASSELNSFTLFYNISSIDIQSNIKFTHSQEITLSKLNFFISNLNPRYEYTIIITSSASKEGLLNSNMVGSNYEIANLRAVNTKKYIVSRLLENNYSLKNINFILNNRSNNDALKKSPSYYRKSIIDIYSVIK